jgi:hypothetical protein
VTNYYEAFDLDLGICEGFVSGCCLVRGQGLGSLNDSFT